MSTDHAYGPPVSKEQARLNAQARLNHEEVQSHVQAPCPSCGHCPTCGRRPWTYIQPSPFYPYPTQPWTYEVWNNSGGSHTIASAQTVVS